jgi:hypothetical protein
MDLVFLQYPLIWLCWIFSLLSVFLTPFIRKYRSALTIFGALAGVCTFFLALFYSIPTEELLLIMVVSSVSACKIAWRGRQS